MEITSTRQIFYQRCIFDLAVFSVFVRAFLLEAVVCD